LAKDTRERILKELQKKVTETYSAELWAGVKAALGVVAGLSLADRSNPLALIFEGASGRGKSTIVNMFDPLPDASKYLYRLDSFTPKAFVTQAANVSDEKLKEIDLLPKLTDKVLITKELAPIFRGRDEELRSNFAILTAVLDGKGHKSASGVHGTRGYEGKHIFNWIGGTTPIPARTDAIMAQLGNRLVRYEIIGEEQSYEELLSFAKNYEPAIVEDICRRLVSEFVSSHFAEFPRDSVKPDRISFPDFLMEQLVRLATLTAKGRVELAVTEEGPERSYVVQSEPEAPFRVILLLRTYALGIALLKSSPSVDAEILDSVRHVAFSSIPRDRRKTLRALLTADGLMNSSKLQQVLRVSRPTARKFMQELAATGIVEFTEGHGNSGDRIQLADEWAWLLSPLAENEMLVCEEEFVGT
jgi:hypothetical protein